MYMPNSRKHRVRGILEYVAEMVDSVNSTLIVNNLILLSVLCRDELLILLFVYEKYSIIFLLLFCVSLSGFIAN